MSGTDLASVVVGAIAIGAAIGARWIVQVVGASPRERAERTLAKWARRAGKPFRGA